MNSSLHTRQSWDDKSVRLQSGSFVLLRTWKQVISSRKVYSISTMRTMTWEGTEFGNFILFASIHLWNQSIENFMSLSPLRRISSHSWNHSQTIFSIEIWRQNHGCDYHLTDFFWKNMVTSSFSHNRKSALRVWFRDLANYCTAALTSLSDSVSYITFLFLEWRIVTTTFKHPQNVPDYHVLTIPMVYSPP